MNKASGEDGIPAELFQNLKDDAMKVLHSICQQIYKIHSGPQDWKRSVFIAIPKIVKAKECLYYLKTALISHVSKVMLKILQARLQDQESLEKYQQPHICRRYPSNGRKWRTKKPLEGERGEWKTGLNLNIQKTKIMASGPITSWQTDG